jgi:hypothetical protein
VMLQTKVIPPKMTPTKVMLQTKVIPPKIEKTET